MLKPQENKQTKNIIKKNWAVKWTKGKRNQAFILKFKSHHIGDPDDEAFKIKQNISLHFKG